MKIKARKAQKEAKVKRKQSELLSEKMKNKKKKS